MALVRKRDTKRTAILAGILVLVIVGGGLAYYFLTRQPVTSTQKTLQTRDLPILTNFGADVLRSDWVRGFRQYGQLPVETQPYGNSNPFEQRF